MIRAYRVVLFCCVLSLIPVAGSAGIYKYRDAAGQLIFVDDESRIPPAYLDSATELSEEAPQEEETLPESAPAEPEAAGNGDNRQEPASADEPPAPLRTPVVIENNRVLVPVTVALGNRTEKLTLLLDTGATSTVLFRQALTGLELPSGKSHQARVAGGGTIRAEKIRFRSISVGPFQINRPYAMVLVHEGRDVPFDGMLGMDFLKSHPYQVDFAQREIVWGAID